MLNTPQRQFWLLVFLVMAGLIWALKPMLLPFIAGLTIAYFLDPVVEHLSKRRVPRWLGTFLVLMGFILSVVFLLLLILPLLQSQLAAFMDAMPGYVEVARTRFLPWIESWMTRLAPGDVDKIRDAAGEYAGSAVGFAGKFAKQLITSGFALFDILALFIITPVVAFYLLRDWPHLAETTDSLLPRKHHTMIKEALAEINRTLSGFIRGQALVCICLGLIYSLGLTMVGLEYGATIGIIAGVLSFVPYVGSTFGLVGSLLLAFLQFHDMTQIGLVLLVFLVGQTLEGYVLTPKLVGDRVGLHPVWILFAIFAGGSLMGFTGVLIAVPVAAVIGVLIRLAIRQYRKSHVYHGEKK